MLTNTGTAASGQDIDLLANGLINAGTYAIFAITDNFTSGTDSTISTGTTILFQVGGNFTSGTGSTLSPGLQARSPSAATSSPASAVR